VGTGLAPNQRFVNKLFSMAMVSLMHTAFPKLVYDKNAIQAPSNMVGAQYGLNSMNGDISRAMMYLSPGQMSGDVLKTIDIAIQYTKDMLGASDAALGEAKPENTSAIIAVSQQAAIPLENIKANLYQFVEDIGYIWLDFIVNYYGVRKVPMMVDEVDEMGNPRKIRQLVDFDFSSLKNAKFRVKVDVGPSSYWSDIASNQTLDNLLKGGYIDIIDYLERVNDGLITKKEELIESIKTRQQQQAQQVQNEDSMEQMRKFMETLPPEEQERLMSLPDGQMEQEVMAMMGGV